MATSKTAGQHPLTRVTPFPKIGIRPTIDGRRRGVREALEHQTMAMANTAADLLVKHLRYPDGRPVECVDMPECVRRLDEGIYDPAEFETARAWVAKHGREGEDVNPRKARKSRAEKAADWDTVVRMTMIARDLMLGNPRLAELGFGEEALGHNALAAGFQGQRHWTDHFPNGDSMEPEAGDYRACTTFGPLYG